MHITLFDDDVTPSLKPFTSTLCAAEIRIGILTVKEKWQRRFPDADTNMLTHDDLADRFPQSTPADEHLFINGRICPGDDLIKEIKMLQSGSVLTGNNTLIAFKGTLEDAERKNGLLCGINKSFKADKTKSEFTEIRTLPDIFEQNAAELEADFNLITRGRKSAPADASNQIIGERVFLEEGAKVSCAVLNSTNGPVYIGKNAEVMEGCTVRGGLAMLENSVLKMGAKIYGATTLGKYVKAGGEVNNCVIFDYSNKGHDGFLGNSVIGKWCNIGADTNCSNLKNNYGSIKIWNYQTEGFEDSGRQFCGLFMGDHSKCGINTMFNTGTVMGVACNIFGAGFPEKFIPDFSWGEPGKLTRFRLEKLFETAERMMERRNKKLSAEEKNVLKRIFDRRTD